MNPKHKNQYNIIFRAVLSKIFYHDLKHEYPIRYAVRKRTYNIQQKQTSEWGEDWES